MFYNNTVLLPSLKSLWNVLRKNSIEPVSQCFYGNRIAIRHYKLCEKNVIRMWKTRSLFDYWYEDFSSSRNFLGAIDYSINDNHIKIEYIALNDGETYTKYYDDVLEYTDADELHNSMICFIKSVAKDNDKPKIILDVHNNLRLYEKYFKNSGFTLTERKCPDNPYWIETEIVLPANSDKLHSM